MLIHYNSSRVATGQNVPVVVGPDNPLPVTIGAAFPTGATPASGVITSNMTATTPTLLGAAPAAGLRWYVSEVTVSNNHATVGTEMQLTDGNGGAVLHTFPAAANFGGAAVSFPTPLRQPTAATGLFIVNTVTGSSTKASIVGYQAA